MIPYNRQKIFKEDAKEVIKSLQNNLITTGPYIRKFEDQIKRKLKVKYASVCSSGTAALHLAIKSIETKKSDIFVLPIINFIQTCSCINIMNNFIQAHYPITLHCSLKCTYRINFRNKHSGPKSPKGLS